MADMIEKKIKELSPYYDGMFPMEGGYNNVRVVIPASWHVNAKETELSQITPVKLNEEVIIGGERVDKLMKVSFVGDPKTPISSILSFVKENIQNNLEQEEKTKLYAKKVKELSDIFFSNTMSKLETLVFKFDKKKKDSKCSVSETAKEANICDSRTENNKEDN